MEIYYCPVCTGKPYTDSIKHGTNCPVCAASLKYEDVLEQSLRDRPRIEYPKKGVKNSKSNIKNENKQKQISVSAKYKKYRSISGTVENVRPCASEPRSLSTKLRHYIMYGQSWSDTLYSFDIKPRDDISGNDRIKVHIYGDYRDDGATICSGYDHTVRGHMAIRNFAEDDNDIFFARKIRNNNCEIRFVRSPFAFMMTVFILYFVYKMIAAFWEPLKKGEALGEIEKVLNDFIPSASAASCFYVIIFVVSAAYIYINRMKTHIRFNFNSVGIFSLLVTILFFMKFKLTEFAGLSIRKSAELILSYLITSSVRIAAAVLGTYILWRFIQIIKRIRG